MQFRCEKKRIIKMAWKFNECTEFNINAGRNAFRCDENFDDWANAGKREKVNYYLYQSNITFI